MTLRNKKQAKPRAALSCTLRVRGVYERLSAAERGVADLVLEQPQRLPTSPLAAAAAASGVSEASVLRFCRRLGYRGYPELKLALAEEAAVRRQDAEREERLRLSESDALAGVPARVFGRTARSLEETLRTLDPREFERAVRALLAAERVDVYAVSGSASIGMDAAAKFLRIGIRCQVFSDSHLQLMAASNLGPRSVAVGISHSGRTKDTVLALDAARRSRATTIAIANHGATHLVEHADIRLLTAGFEAALPRDALVSRISQMAVVDALCLGVLLEGYSRFRGRLARVEQILADKLYTP